MILRILFWSMFAALVACIEIEIEGKDGWAEKLPTWYRMGGDDLKGRLQRMLTGGKPLTGYNVFMFALPMMIFHVPFVNGADWSWQAELEAWALYFVWCVLWDYFWFVLNPHYHGKFKRDRIWWHAKSPWVFGLFPVDYLVFTSFSIVFAGMASLVAGSYEPLIRHGMMISGFVVFTAWLHLIAPLYRRWYARMRKHDERDRANIFHVD